MNKQNIVLACQSPCGINTERSHSSRGFAGSAIGALMRCARRKISSFEGARWACKCALGLALLTALGSSAVAADFTCTPTEVSVYSNRIHVKCSVAQPDGSASIWYWAVPSTDPQWTNRFVAITSTALVSGRTLLLRYTPGDATGQSFGCLSHDCRQVYMFAVR